MAKRTLVKKIRHKADKYYTPERPVRPLIPHLPDEFTFFEPCAGDGRLARHICAMHPGARCVGMMDIEPDHEDVRMGDALRLQPEMVAEADFIITNPPWSRGILHALIPRFSRLKPTWLLYDADWMHTGQSEPYLQYLRAIVSVGRVRWFEDSKMDGKDNVAWYRFGEPRDNNKTIFIGRNNEKDYRK